MSIKYCDYITGDDDTGDGTAGTPYKTITKASLGLSGGDEVRVAKSPAISALTGTVGFTKNSTAVTGVDTLFTAELVIGDFILGGDGYWWEVVTITDDTNAVLFQKYPSATGAGVNLQKLGVTSTGEAAATSTQVQVVSVSGTSAASRLKISGGWDLTGPTQDGQTYFRQMHSTFANRYGYGLYSNGKHYWEMERLHFLRYNFGIYFRLGNYCVMTSPNFLGCTRGIYTDRNHNNIITSPILNGNAAYGFHLNGCNNNTITNPVAHSNVTYGLYIINSRNNTIDTPVCHYNGTHGIYVESGGLSTIISPTCNGNSNGIYMYRSHSNLMTPTATCNDNTAYGVRTRESWLNIVNGFTGTGNTTADMIVDAGYLFSDRPCIKAQHFEAVGANLCFYEYGITYRDTVDARAGECLKYDPTSAIYYISQSFFFTADSGVAQTLSAYVKDDAAFNGDIQAAIYFQGNRITGWSEWTPAEAYAQKTIVAGAGDITEDGVLELRIKVRGTAGNVFVDDLATA